MWVLTGFWHGASWNFVLWGVFYGILLIIEKLFLLKRLQKLPAFVGHLYTMFAVLMGWVLFAFDRIGDGFSYYGALFGRSGLSNQNAASLLLSNLPLLLICLAAATPIPTRIGEKLSGHCNEGALATAASFRMFVLFGLSVAYLISGSYNPFLYFRF